jgi:ABC-type antimicrobial peptide transport system permease subunit
MHSICPDTKHPDLDESLNQNMLPDVQTTVYGIAFTVCFCISVFFGWYPARKASNLNPIDALRYE